MTEPVHKVAILHRDDAIAARVARLAAGAGLAVVRAASFAALAQQAGSPFVSAVITDLPAPRDGGIDILQRLQGPTSRAMIIVITDADQQTADAAGRTAAAKGIAVAIFRSQAIDEAKLMRALCSGRDQAPSFGPGDIEDCLDHGRFRVEYQPKVSLLTTSATSPFGVEALCRMTDPRFGAISPDKFIPMAEKCGLIAKLTDAVVCEAFRAWQAWKSAGLPLRLALNVSPVLLDDTNWSESFLQRCAEFSMEPKWLTLEITETAAGATNPRACEILTQLQRKGFSLSIDDFGTGFSSLSTLYRLPIAEMKIDKSFILDLQGTAGARELVESAIAMAKRMNIKVVAEGVETESVFHELRKMGCHEVQGFFIGRSMRSEAVVPFFTGWKQSALNAPSAGGAAGLPKVAILQAIVNEIANDRSLEARSALPGPYGGGTRRVEAQTIPKDIMRKIPPLALEGKSVAALALCHTAVRQLEVFPECNEMRAKIAQLQAVLEQELVTRADLEIRTNQGRFRLLARDSVSLGRFSPTSRVDIPVKCRWFSAGEKNLRLFAKAGQWLLEDLGSSHGHMLDGKRLKVRQPVELSLGKTLVQVRLASGAVAPLSLVLHHTSVNPDAVTISFDYDAESLRSELGAKDWAELEGELDCSWIVFNGNVDVGKSSTCALVLEDCPSPVAATIHFNEGYWISPVADTPLAIDDTLFDQDVPLVMTSPLHLGECRLTAHEIPRETVAPAKAALIEASAAYRLRQA